MTESRYFRTGEPGGPRLLPEWAGERGTIRPGDQVAMDNPAYPDGLPLPLPLTVTELVDFGDFTVVVLGDSRDPGKYETDAANLRLLPAGRAVVHVPGRLDGDPAAVEAARARWRARWRGLGYTVAPAPVGPPHPHGRLCPACTAPPAAGPAAKAGT